MYLVTMITGYRVATFCSMRYESRADVETIEFMKNIDKAIGLADMWR